MRDPARTFSAFLIALLLFAPVLLSAVFAARPPARRPLLLPLTAPRPAVWHAR